MTGHIFRFCMNIVCGRGKKRHNDLMKIFIRMLIMFLFVSSFANASLVKVDAHCDMEMQSKMTHTMQTNFAMEEDCCPTECQCSELLLMSFALMVVAPSSSFHPNTEKVTLASFAISEAPPIALKRPPIAA